MKPYKHDITAEQAATWITYNPNTGRIKRIDNEKSFVYKVNDDGRLVCQLPTGKYMVHRLAWLLFYGRWPNGHIDHINGDPSDNRISNLREASHAVNMQNQRRPHKNSRSQLLGASLDTSRTRPNPWRAQITVNGKTKRIGWFKTAEEAHAAYIAVKRMLHEGCTI